MTDQEKADIRARIEVLSNQMFGLECSDERLFSNGNGNRHLWESWSDERHALSKKLEEAA